jgi:Tfp pilus assembly protein PilF
MAATEDRGDAGAASRMSRALKWVGAATAVISLILGARQLIGIATDRAQRGRDSAEFTALARQQADRGEFAEAWQSLDRAEQRSRTPALDSARLEIAFRWLEEGRPGAGQPFTRITDAVTPALDRALLNPKDPRRPDILAHMGWATFLKSRETGTGDPAALYKQALAIDPHNVYANVMLAHWMVWQGEPLTAARPYFDQALATGKERALVRTFQLAALRNRNDDPAEAEMIRVAASMRQQNEPVDDRSARAAYVAFRHRYGPNAPPSDPSVVGISAAEQLATFRWLTQKPGVSERPDVDTAISTTLTKLMSRS